jgi:O-antigen ligase
MKSDTVILYCDRTIVFCLCLFIFCLPLIKAGAQVFIWFAIFLWLLKRALGYRSQALRGMLPGSALNKALGVFIAVNAISTIFSVNFGLSLKALFGKELKFIAIYFLAVETINSGKRLRNILTVMIFSAVLLASDAAVQYFRGVDFIMSRQAVTRLTASFANPNSFAGWLIMFIPVFCGLLLISGKKAYNWKVKILLIILIFLLLACLALTYTRSAWIGILTSFSLGVCYLFRKLFPGEKKILLLIFAGLFLMFLFLPRTMKVGSALSENLNFPPDQPIQERVISTESVLIRGKLWEEALSIIEDFPLLGAGLNTYSRVAVNYKMSQYGGTYPHNSFLQMAAETGILGLLSFLWILFEFFKGGFFYLHKINNPLVLGLLCGIAAFLVQSFADTNLYALQSVVLFWFMLGLTAAVTKIEGLVS